MNLLKYYGHSHDEVIITRATSGTRNKRRLRRRWIYDTEDLIKLEIIGTSAETLRDRQQCRKLVLLQRQNRNTGNTVNCCEKTNLN